MVRTPFYLVSSGTDGGYVTDTVDTGWNISTTDPTYTHTIAGSLRGPKLSLTYYKVSNHSVYLCRQNKTTGVYSWQSSALIYNTTIYSTFYNVENAIPQVSSAPVASDCGPVTCPVGRVTYDLKQYDNEDNPPASTNVCTENCQNSAEILWNDCLAGSCVASVKYTTTGQSCGTEPVVNDTTTDPPDRCTNEINEKIQQCGGSLNVLSFDFESCTGECTPDACGDQWNALVDRCGGIMAVSNWDAKTCSGSCASDPVPDPSDPQSQAVPVNTSSETTNNSDGTKDIKVTNTYYVDGDTVTTTTTTSYDSSGNQTGTSTTTSRSSGTGSEDGEDEETFTPIQSSGFSTPYVPGEYDIPARFTTFLNNVKSSGLFSFSSSFFNSLPGGGSPLYAVQAGRYGTHTVDLSQTMAVGLAVLKSILLACFGFLSIRAVIMKR